MNLINSSSRFQTTPRQTWLSLDSSRSVLLMIGAPSKLFYKRCGENKPHIAAAPLIEAALNQISSLTSLFSSASADTRSHEVAALDFFPPPCRIQTINIQIYIIYTLCLYVCVLKTPPQKLSPQMEVLLHESWMTLCNVWVSSSAAPHSWFLHLSCWTGSNWTNEGSVTEPQVFTDSIALNKYQVIVWKYH